MSEHRTRPPDYLRLLTPVSNDTETTMLRFPGGQDWQAGRRLSAIRVLVAEGQTLVRAAYRALLESDERIEVVGEAATCDQAQALARRMHPDVVLLDLALAGLEHSDNATWVVWDATFSGAAVMLMTPSETDERVFAALRAGSVGVLRRDAEPAELKRAVRLLASGQAVLPSRLMRRLIGELPPRRPGDQPLAEQLEELTDREREVVSLVGMGLTNGEIAEQLVISPATAKTHVYRAMTKLHAHHRAQLAVLAHETGLVLARSQETEILAIA